MNKWPRDIFQIFCLTVFYSHLRWERIVVSEIRQSFEKTQVLRWWTGLKPNAWLTVPRLLSLVMFITEQSVPLLIMPVCLCLYTLPWPKRIGRADDVNMVILIYLVSMRDDSILTYSKRCNFLVVRYANPKLQEDYWMKTGEDDENQRIW